MKVLVQWAQRNPGDWEEVEARDWASLPSRAQPPRNGRHGGKDDLPGWVCDLNVQGVHFNGQDHIAVEPVTIGAEEGVRVTAWNDDPEDWPVGERSAHVWTFLPLAPDPNLGGAINTRQFQLIYAEGERFARLEAALPQNTMLRPWSEFVPPAESLVRHGVWLEDEKWEEHRRSSRSFQGDRDEVGWRHWCDHLPDSECERDGRGRRVLKGQREQGRYRIPSHTKTYYLRDTNLAQGWVSATNENALDTSPGTGQTESVTANSATVVGWAFASPSNEPGSASWPTATYHSQLDCTAASSGLIYYHQPNLVFQQHYLLAVSSDLSSTVDVSDTVSSTFSGTGLKSMSYSWTSPPTSTGDRFVVPVAATGDSHGDAITLRFSSDAYADGPWSTGFTGTMAATITKATSSLTGHMAPSGVISSTLQKALATLTGVMQTSGVIASTLQEPTASLTGAQSQSGAIVSALQAALFSGAGAHIQSGAIASTLQRPTAAFIGVMHPSGSIASTLQEPTAAFTGAHIQTGSIVSTLQEPTFAGTGTHTGNEQTGTMASTLQAATASLAGAQTQSGAIVSTLQRATFAATGVMLPSGVISSALQKATASLTGQHIQSGTIASTLQRATASLAGAHSQSGAITSTLQEPTFSGSGVMLPSGVIAATITRALMSASGSHAQSGSIASTMQALTASLTALQIYSGIIASTLQEPTFSASGLMQPSGVISSTLQEPTFSATGIHSQTGAIISTIQALTFSAEGTGGTIYTGALSSQLQAALFSGSAQVHPIGSLAGTMQAAAFSGAGAQVYIATLASTLQAILFSGSGVMQPSGVLAATLQALLFTTLIAGEVIPFIMDGQPKWLYAPGSRLSFGTAQDSASPASRMPHGPAPRVQPGRSRQ